MKTKRVIGLRGLARGRGHWGSFPKDLSATDASIELDLLDIPGNGTRCSEKLPLQAEKAVEMIRAQSRWVQNQETFSILGISFGGMLALKWAEMYPKEVSKVFIVNSSLAQYSPFFKRLQVNQLLSIVKAMGEIDFVAREKTILSITSNQIKNREEHLALMAAFSKKYQVSPSSFFRQLLLATTVRISNLKKPELMVIGSHKDRLVDVSCSLKIAEGFGVTPIIHPTAGHDIPLDDPLWLAKLISQELVSKG